MMPLVNEPMMEHIVRLLRSHGFDEIVVTVAFMANSIRSYFGDETNTYSEPIWVEIQWTAWVLDGGVPLVLVYAAAILVAGAAVLRAARHTPDLWLAGWAALGGAYTVAVFGLTFSYAPFIVQTGMEFWLLNSLFVTAARTVARRRRTGAPP